MPKKKPIAAQVNAGTKQLRKLSKRMTRAITDSTAPTNPIHETPLYISRAAWLKRDAVRIAGAMRRCGAKQVKIGGKIRGVYLVRGRATAQQLAVFCSVEARREQQRWTT